MRGAVSGARVFRALLTTSALPLESGRLAATPLRIMADLLIVKEALGRQVGKEGPPTTARSCKAREHVDKLHPAVSLRGCSR